MDPRPVSWIVTACGGVLVRGRGDQVVSAVGTDSRRVAAGSLFIALKGDRFDGHDFLGTAVAGGATAVMVEDEPAGDVVGAAAVIRVPDARAALGRLAAAYRRELRPAGVVAVGGSNGKTTSKDLLACLLATAGATLCSPASFNNDIGVPLTLLGLGSRHRYAVLEVGTNHPGELAPLTAAVAPDHGWITSIGREHLEHFGDLDGVVAEEGTLVEAIPASGVVVLPGDSEHVAALAGRARARVIRVGLNPGLDWVARPTGGDWEGEEFRVDGPRDAWCGSWRVPIPGRHSICNALGALALAAELGTDPEAVRAALAGFRPPAHRLHRRAAGGVRLLDDTYNANADSMVAALETFSGLPCAGRRVAVLGDMAELGRHTEAAHGEVGKLAAARVDALFAVGRHSPVTCDAARGAGLADSRAYEAGGSAVDDLVAYLRPGDAVLLKASRSSRLDELAAELERRMGGKEAR